MFPSKFKTTFADSAWMNNSQMTEIYFEWISLVQKRQRAEAALRAYSGQNVHMRNRLTLDAHAARIGESHVYQALCKYWEKLITCSIQHLSIQAGTVSSYHERIGRVQ